MFLQDRFIWGFARLLTARVWQLPGVFGLGSCSGGSFLAESPSTPDLSQCVWDVVVVSFNLLGEGVPLGSTTPHVHPIAYVRFGCCRPVEPNVCCSLL